jgi:hypothetical protein
MFCKFDESLTNIIPITVDEWNRCVKSLEDFRISSDEDSIEAYNSSTYEWIPIFWLSRNFVYMNANAFDNEFYISKAIELVVFFDAYLIGEDDEIIYLPNYGLLYDTYEEIISLRLDEYKKLCKEFHGDVNRIIKEHKNRIKILSKEDKEIIKKLERKYKYQKQMKPWWQFW